MGNLTPELLGRELAGLSRRINGLDNSKTAMTHRQKKKLSDTVNSLLVSNDRSSSSATLHHETPGPEQPPFKRRRINSDKLIVAQGDRIDEGNRVRKMRNSS